MRKLLLLAAFIYAGVSVSGQTPVASVKLQFKNISSGSVHAVLPVNHTFFWAASKEIPISKDGICSIPITESQTGYVVITGFNRAIRAFIQKGDHLVVDIDTSAAAIPQFKGIYAEGQALLSSRKFPGSYYSIEGMFRKDSTPELLSVHIQDEKTKQEASFNELFQQGKINKSFMDFIKLHFDYLYAAAAVECMSNRFYAKNYSPSNPFYRPDFPVSYQKYWDDILTQYPVKKLEGYHVQSFEYYVDSYINAYHDYQRWKVKDTSSHSGDAYIPYVIKKIKTAFADNSILAEQVEARCYYFLFIQEKFEKVLPELVADFAKTYPNSAYTNILKPYNDKVLEFYQTASKEFGNDQKVVNEYLAINSFAALKENLKEKCSLLTCGLPGAGLAKRNLQIRMTLQNILPGRK